jgi:FtsZ-binding cell division protein ZapB
MATSKVKGTNKKIKELKGVKPEKITDEELERVQAAINNINRIQLEIGNLESKKHEMLHGASTFREELGLLQAQFQKDYGTFDVNIQDGTINYTKENGKVNKED